MRRVCVCVPTRTLVASVSCKPPAAPVGCWRQLVSLVRCWCLVCVRGTCRVGCVVSMTECDCLCLCVFCVSTPASCGVQSLALLPYFRALQ